MSANNFGSPGQRAFNGTKQSSKFDAKHDMILAMIDWVEKGNAPKELIGSSYIGGNKAAGIAFQRKLCP